MNSFTTGKEACDALLIRWDREVHATDIEPRDSIPMENRPRKLIDFTKRPPSSQSEPRLNQSSCNNTTNQTTLEVGKLKTFLQNLSDEKGLSSLSPGTKVHHFPSFRSLDQSLPSVDSISLSEEEDEIDCDDERIEFMLKVEPRTKRLIRSSSRSRAELVRDIQKFSRNALGKRCEKPRSPSLGG